MSVEERGERSIRAHGTVRGRTITAEVDGGSARSEFGRFFFGLNTLSSRNRREKWHTMLSVSCGNPAGVTGTIESAVDVSDPAWKPGQGPRRLLDAEVVLAEGGHAADRIAVDVLANVAAMEAAIELATSANSATASSKQPTWSTCSLLSRPTLSPAKVDFEASATVHPGMPIRP